MKTLTPKVKFIFIALFVLLFGITNLSAQSSISKSDNGKVICEYKKKDQNTYQVVLVYKNDQYIYTPEIDSVVLQSNESLQSFIKDFRIGIASLDQKDATFNTQRNDCRLFKYVHTMNGAFINMSNASGGVVTSQNKWEAQQLLDWLVGIQWGKE